MGKQQSSWPFKEAKNIKLQDNEADKEIIFETGFGPSGRPHIGTFAEVARTIMVMNAFKEQNPGLKPKLYAFCDDMDGLRKVPGNIPSQELIREHLGKSLINIPDPFGTERSYAHHMEHELEVFLSRFGFEFELKSSAEEYKSGVFNKGLHLILERYEKVRGVILPTLQEENRKGWSPIIPTCENCQKIYTTKVTGYDADADTVTYECSGTFGTGENEVTGCGHKGEVSILDGNVKVGWKVDWALRWFTYNICYEMYGKDLIDSAKLSGKITRILGGIPPAGMVYELFLDESGKKISKSVGKGLTVDSWMDYAPIESLIHYLFQNPRKQRKLFFEMIPKNVDDYLVELANYSGKDESKKLDSVVWHLKKIGRAAPKYTSSINFSLILNLISALGAGDSALLWDYVLRYDSDAENNRDQIDGMVERAVAYYQDFVEPNKKYRGPDETEKALFKALLEKLEPYDGDDEKEYQSMVFDAAKENGEDPKALFKAFYEVILGQERGPRFGTFAKLVGKGRAIEMLKEKLD
jgi:lysyl-tRNA synthetase, class I